MSRHWDSIQCVTQLELTHFQRKMSCLMLRRHLNPRCSEISTNWAPEAALLGEANQISRPSISTSCNVSYACVYMCSLYCNRAMAEEGEKLASKIGPVSLHILRPLEFIICIYTHLLYMCLAPTICSVIHISFQMLRDLNTYLQKVNQIYSLAQILCSHLVDL